MSQESVISEAIEIEDIEQAAQEGRKPRPAKHYRIRVDKQHFTVAVSTMTGYEILVLAGKQPPNTWKLFEVIKGQKVPVLLDQIADFTREGIERFTTLPLEQTEG
jgi:hypothetical protein